MRAPGKIGADPIEFITNWWLKAPFFGTAILLFALVSVLAMYRGEIEQALLWAIIGGRFEDRRREYLAKRETA